MNTIQLTGALSALNDGHPSTSTRTPPSEKQYLGVQSLPIKKRPLNVNRGPGRPSNSTVIPMPSGFIAQRLRYQPKTKSGYKGAFCWGHDVGENREQCTRYADRIPTNLPWEYSCIKIRGCKKHNDRRNNKLAHNHTLDCEVCRGINSPFATNYKRADGTEFLLCLYCADLYAPTLGIADEFFRTQFPPNLLGLASLCECILNINH